MGYPYPYFCLGAFLGVLLKHRSPIGLSPGVRGAQRTWLGVRLLETESRIVKLAILRIITIIWVVVKIMVPFWVP